MRLVIIFALLLSLKKITWCIPLSQFYPYGQTESDDVLLLKADDGTSPGVSLSSVFPFYDKNFQTIYVNTNGALTFTNGTLRYSITEFPTNRGYEIMAAFWADVDTRGTGTVSYRNTTDANLLQRASGHIKRAFPTIAVSLDYLFIATWDHVGFYDMQTVKTNTFQAVLATDGLRSYVIYLYADGEIQWTSGDSSHGFNGLYGKAGQVGFDAGDGIRHTDIPASYTNAIINVTHTSNVGIPGVWVFRVDGETMVTGGCQPIAASGNVSVPLTLYPRYGNVLGGTVVQVFGPCFGGYADRNITCSFDGIKVAGIYVDDDSIICVSPALTSLGRVEFVLNISGTAAKFEKTTFYSLTTDDASFIELNGDDLLYMSDEGMEITWDQHSLLPQLLTEKQDVTVTVNIQLAEIDIVTGSTRTIANLASDVANSGQYHAVVPSEYKGISPAVVQITIANINNGESSLRSLVGHLDNVYNQIKGQLAQWSREIYISDGSTVLREQCEEWYKNEPIGIGDDILERLPPCPPTESRITSVFVKEDCGDAFMEFFHPSTVSCYRQIIFTSDNQGSGQQCCYDSNGDLVIGQSGGGTVDRYATNTFTGRLKHLRHDVLPYVYCCQGDFKKYTCDMYYERRPSDDGSEFSLRPPACLYGDPHLVTLDGYKYTFNGKGEFTLVGHKDDIFVLQGRMVEVENSDGQPAGATVFSAVVAKQYNSDTVELRQSRRGLDALVNGVMVNFEDLPTQYFDNVILSDQGNQMLTARFSSGVHIEAEVENGIISVLLVSLPDSFYNATYGLMGVFNKDMTDDLMIRHSAQHLPLNSSNDEIHMQFGLTWIVDADSSLFTYPLGKSRDTYNDLNFSPSYNPVFLDSSIESHAMDVCGDDQFCLYDIATTGRIEIGLSTLDGSRNFDKIVNLSYPITCEPPCVQGACVANNTCNCAEGYAGERCRDSVYGPCDINRCKNGGRCYKMASSYVCECPNGYTGLLCQHFNVSGSDDDGSDDDSIGKLLKEPLFAIVAGVVGGGTVILVVMIICAVGCCCHIRSHRKGKLTVNPRPNHTNPMYDMNLFLVPDKAVKTDTDTTSSSIRPLVAPHTAESNGVPVHQAKHHTNHSSSQRQYDNIALDLNMTENPYTVP